MSGPTLSLLFSLLNVLLAPLRERLLDNRVNVDLLKDQEQELVWKETDRRPQRNRSTHRYRDHDLLDGLGSVAVSLDAPPMILLSRQVPVHSAHVAINRVRMVDLDNCSSSLIVGSIGRTVTLNHASNVRILCRLFSSMAFDLMKDWMWNEIDASCVVVHHTHIQRERERERRTSMNDLSAPYSSRVSTHCR